MAIEFINWLQDIGQHLRVRRQRQTLRQPGQGVDYTQPHYDDLVWRVVSRLHPGRMRLRVTDVIQETPSSKSFHFERLDGPLPPFRAGQYVNLFVDVDGIPTSRPYSIASPPGSQKLVLTVRDNPGGFVAPYLLAELRVGDEVETSGPAGSFYVESLIDGTELLFLAGGSGITPFMSILRDTLQRKLPVNMHLLYGSRTPDDVIFGQELAQLAATHDNFSYTLVISEPPPGYEGVTGFLDANLIQELLGGASDTSSSPLTGKTCYICGPEAMYHLCLAALGELGVPAHRIRREFYGPPADVTRETDWPQEIVADSIYDISIEGGPTVRGLAKEPLMNTLERYGITMPATCRNGTCSACRIRLLSGQVYMPAHTSLRDSDRQHGYIHGCVSYPLSDVCLRF